MPYKPLDIFQDLPKTNCGYCGRPGCLPFAMAVYLGDAPLSACTQLTPEKAEEIRQKLEAQKRESKGGGQAVEQALEFLMGKVGEADLAELARKSGSEYIPGPPDAVRLELFGEPYLASGEGVKAEDGGSPGVTVKVFLLIYLTRASGAKPAGEWAAFREFPNTVSKAKQFEASAAGLARAYDGRSGDLAAAAARLGGAPDESGSADLAFIFQALPRVRLYLLFWDSDEDFEARASILLDKGALDYLDQEAMVFLAEAFAALIKGESIHELLA